MVYSTYVRFYEQLSRSRRHCGRPSLVSLVLKPDAAPMLSQLFMPPHGQSCIAIGKSSKMRALHVKQMTKGLTRLKLRLKVSAK
jgi:hypothetical protein